MEVGTREDIDGDYGRLLSSSKFCLVVPGMMSTIHALDLKEE